MGTPKESWSVSLDEDDNQWSPRVMFGDWTNTRGWDGKTHIAAEVWDRTVYGSGRDEVEALMSLADEHDRMADKVRMLAFRLSKQKEEGKR